jgi:hypothetical protein
MTGSGHNKRLPFRNRLVCAAGAALVCLSFASCAGYRLGSALPPGLEAIHVPVFENKTGEPQLESVTTSVTIQEFHRDGTLKVADAASADVRLEVVLTDFRLEPLRYERDDTRRTREYRLHIKANLVLKERKTDGVLLQKQVQGDSTFIPEGDLTAAKRDALPDAASDLAHDIVESVVEYW